MDTQRAKQIATSPVMANVTYNSIPIYIDSVNAKRGTANIHYLNHNKHQMVVSLSKLEENQL